MPGTAFIGRKTNGVGKLSPELALKDQRAGWLGTLCWPLAKPAWGLDIRQDHTALQQPDGGKFCQKHLFYLDGPNIFKNICLAKAHTIKPLQISTGFLLFHVDMEAKKERKMWPHVCFQLLISNGSAFSGMKTNWATLLSGLYGASRLLSLLDGCTKSSVMKNP